MVHPALNAMYGSNLYVTWLVVSDEIDKYIRMLEAAEKLGKRMGKWNAWDIVDKLYNKALKTRDNLENEIARRSGY